MKLLTEDRPAVPQLTGEAIDQIFRNARSYSRWQPYDLSDDVIRQLYEIAVLGPTSVNGNPARFVWVRSEAGKRRLADCVKPGNVVKVLGASATVIIAYDPEFYLRLGQLMPHAAEALITMFREDPRDAWETAFRNSALQGGYLIMAARALGLDCGPLSGFYHDKVNDAFFAGSEVRVNFLCCIGRGSEEALFPRNPRLPFEEANQII